ncbi:MAG: 5-(carboxyamino)imidazole ribonucleotide synthase [Bacteroidota bacterium]
MSQYFSSDFMLGILGGGQLGKMLLQETSRMDIRTAVLDPSSFSPCKGRAEVFEVGDLKDFETVYRFGKLVDVLTFEIEHINVDALAKLESEGTQVYPSAKLLRTIQDKGLQKDFYRDHQIPTSPFFRYKTKAELLNRELDFPCVQKLAREGYDGRGVNILRSREDVEELPDGAGLIEDYVGDKQEISVIVARSVSGETQVFPSVEMDFHPTANLVEFLYSPANLTGEMEKRVAEVALQVAAALDLVGVLAVEMFVTPSGEVLVNESAPRPHNSGHHTIESNYTSQYEQHVRAILNLPLGSVTGRSAAVMVNLLGEEGHTGYVCYEGIEEALRMEGVYVHVYGKKQTRPFRKMGHVTIVADTLAEARKKAIIVKEKLKVVTCKTL